MYSVLTHPCQYTHTHHSHLNRGRLEQLVAEHLDHLHYISDILSLNVQSLNDVLVDHLLNRLLIPLYVYSLTDQNLGSEEVSYMYTHSLWERDSTCDVCVFTAADTVF